MKEFAFIDLHIHTKYSFEHGCDLEVEELLDILAAIAEKENKDIAFSISDHESVLGAIKASELIAQNPEKYKRLYFIPGIEINTSLKSVEINENGKSTYSKCHMLGYGYNLNDKNLIAYSKLMHKVTYGEKSKKVNTGRQLCWARKELEQHYKKNLPFKLFEVCADCSTHEETREKFIQIVSSYLRIDKKEIETFIEPMFGKTPINSELAVGQAKLDIFDVIRLIKQAGGKTSIAHPGMLKFDKKDFESYGKKLSYYKRFVRIVQKKSHNGIDALEIFHKDNTLPGIFETLFQIAKENNLNFTCGSDHHGSLYPHSILSKCFARRFEFASLTQEEKDKGEVTVANRVVSLPILDDYFKTGSHYDKKYSFLCKHSDGKRFGINVVQKVLYQIRNVKAKDFRSYYNIDNNNGVQHQKPKDRKKSNKYNKKKKLKNKTLQEQKDKDLEKQLKNEQLDNNF